MEITINIHLNGLEGGNLKMMEEFLTSIEKFKVKVIMIIDSSGHNTCGAFNIKN